MLCQLSTNRLINKLLLYQLLKTYDLWTVSRSYPNEDLLLSFLFFFFLKGSRNDDRSLEKVRDSVEMHKKRYHWKFDEELQYVDT